MGSGCCPSVKRKPFVMPAFAGMQYKPLDSGLRRNDSEDVMPARQMA